jgi:hypothetical protein
MLGLLGTTRRRWRWGPLRLWDSLGLVGTRWDSCDVHSCHVFLHSRAHLGLAGVETFIIFNNTHQSQMPHPRNSWATMIHFSSLPSEFESTCWRHAAQQSPILRAYRKGPASISENACPNLFPNISSLPVRMYVCLFNTM